MAITSELIKKLRDKTGAGMMDCKKALESTGGSMEEAVEFLRKKGAAISAKRADRSAKEGLILTRVTPDGSRGIMVEVNCETDFVGRSDDFTSFSAAVAEAIEKHGPKNLEDLPALQTRGGKTIGEMLNDLLAKVGEKIDIRRFSMLTATDGTVFAYTHVGGKIGVLVDTSLPADAPLGRDIAMQIAAMNPLVVNRDQVEKTIIEREIDIYRTQAGNEGKPAHIAEKIAVGRLEKFYQEVVLTEQTFIKDSAKTIRDLLAEAKGTVRSFHRYHLGEEVK